LNAANAAAVISAAIALLVAVASSVTILYKRGQNEGRLTEILSQLTTMSADHEARLRVLERTSTTGAPWAP
jgi:hypothetical protein